jgi:hypothetical protein
MEPITSGFQVAVDPAYDIDRPPHYTIGVSTQAHSSFSGGGLRDLTSQLRNGVLRLDNVGKTFDIEFALANGSSASAVIYRQCFAPETVLLLVLKNAQKTADGADWLWVKSGKYATVQ